MFELPQIYSKTLYEAHFSCRNRLHDWYVM